ncbi:phospholipase D-like domain-containing protein [Alloalcanivorax gelatiniphagus]|uniref:Phospholipase n=1 Tax=Alloalcanivorax gelatiniphagus TaxID=1194167 RepID=A0ABY2XFN3_9GAMM|nr:phospholipase D-like domain-containing protein [Alloalcanivorax gelatiniphagus]TMW10411.1 phospholipase [Alloalcanivorax gelatiniphagus]|tara:strand:+ start:7296 stop:8753 length:1458 start_codon:yes stop_codon:yes gene_type:complete
MPRHRPRPLRLLLLVLLCAWLLTALYHRYKPLPEDVGRAWPVRDAENLALLADDTWVEGDAGEEAGRQYDQAIFDEFFRLIGQADKLIVVDMFLYNDMAGATTDSLRPLSEQLTDALVARKQQRPHVRAVLITDPFNTLYGGVAAPHLQRLRDAGVEVVFTDLTRLRDSNPTWSGLWRLCCQWFGNSTEGGWLPNPTGDGKVTLRTYLSLINFKANHRKTLVVDEGNQWTGLVTSANAHDASSAHSNLALRFSGPAALDLLQSELAVANFSGANLGDNWPAPPAPAAVEKGPRLRVLDEGAIRDALLETVNGARAGQHLDVGVFYLSQRPLVEALAAAQERGVRLRLLLDPNKDAFGREKNGVPNRQVAWELHRAGVPVRWCATHGEQCHTKMLLRYGAHRPATLILGSANYTRRNLDNLNLETSVELVAEAGDPTIRAAREIFQKRWSNPDGKVFSLPYEDFADDSRWRYGLYRVMEFTGWSTF